MRFNRTLSLALATLAVAAGADPFAFELKTAGLAFSAELPAESGPWRVESQADPAGAFDVIAGGGAQAVSIVVAIGDDCDQGFSRLVKRSGLALLRQGAYFGDRFRAEGTEDVNFRTDTTIHVGCAQGVGRSLVVVLAHAGHPDAIGPSPRALFDALGDAFKAAGEAVVPFASPGGAVSPALSSAATRARYMADPSAAEAAVARRTGTFTLPAGTPVIVALDEVLSSKTAIKGAALPGKVADDVLVDEAIVIAAGTAITGSIIDASSGGIGGRPGRFVFEFTTVNAVDGQPVALKHRTEKSGKAEDAYHTFISINFTAGSQVEIEPGTPLEASTAKPATVTVK